MEIIKWEPLNELDRFIDDRIPFPRFARDLAVDLYEENGAVVAKMDLPGMDRDNLDIAIENNVLSVTGSREEEQEVDKKDYYSKEIRRGSFSRSIALPTTVDPGKAIAAYKNGILTVTIPMKEGAKADIVKVKVTD